MFPRTKRAARTVLVRISPQTRFLEHLIHSVKNDLVERIEELEQRIDEHDQTVAQVIADQSQLQMATINRLRAELELARSAPGGSAPDEAVVAPMQRRAADRTVGHDR
ncbi:MAG: hypothetical protein ACK5PP_12540 [Acidimicrobiales bacterium]